MQTPTLTHPVTDLAKVRNTTREALALTDAEIEAILDLEEYFVRIDFGVYGTDAGTNDALSRALVAGFQSFRKQLAQMTSETVGASSYSITVGNVEWPRVVGMVLAPVADPGALPGVSDVVEFRRDDDYVRRGFGLGALRPLGLIG